jgi:serine/threonine protein kinase
MADDLVIGGQLGNYLIESVIGRGGMSVVYRARHSRLGTSVALKVLAPELSSDDTFRERFLREAQMAAEIDHPNVVPIHDLGLHDNSLYIVMRYVAGGDLKALLASSGLMDPDSALALLEPAAQALDAAHARGLVHRDVKPGNILIQQSSGEQVEHVYLTDFGIAKSAHVSGLTRVGGMLGTVEYMAPEQAEGHPVSAKTDVYALAGVFYECITGRIPYERELAEGSFPPSGRVAPATRFRPELPSALDDVLAKALSRNPADRYDTCVQFIQACRSALQTQSSTAAEIAGATVADVPSPGGETVASGDSERWAEAASSAREPALAGGSDPWPPIGSAPPPASPPPPPARSGGRGRGRLPLYAGGAAVAVAAVVAAIALSSSSSSKPSGKPFATPLGQVPTNHVTGSGSATIHLNGDTASVTLTTNALDYGEQLGHALHIHAGGKGICPPASAARPHNGHLTISTTDGIKYYGAPALALTTSGDTTPASILAFSRYPTGGNINYTRTITLPSSVVKSLKENNAVVIVHGTDYDHTGTYTGVLDRSELNKAVPGTQTAPALCGTLVEGQKAQVGSGSRPSGAVYTASLVETAVPMEGQFVCEAGSRPAAVRARREQA